MNFELKDKNGVTLLTGSKQDCMHFIKRRALDRRAVTLVPKITKDPAPHYTVPVTAEVEPKKGFFKRFF